MMNVHTQNQSSPPVTAAHPCHPYCSTDNYTHLFHLALSGLARGWDALLHARFACLAACGGDKEREKLGRPQTPQRGLPPLGTPLSGQVAKMCIIVRCSEGS